MTADSDRVAELAHQVVAEHDPKNVPIPEYLGACYDAGLSWVHFPESQGGLAVSRGLQAVADRILQGAGGPVPLGLNPMGYGMAAPTISASRIPRPMSVPFRLGAPAYQAPP